MIEKLPLLMPFTGTKEEYDELRERAKEDGHGVFFPTDVVWKGEERVGWFSVGAVPLMWAWVSTKGQMKVRDTLQVLQTIEGVQRRLGAPGLFAPCSKTSPFFGYFEKLGYLRVSDDSVCFFKPFNRRQDVFPVNT